MVNRNSTDPKRAFSALERRTLDEAGIPLEKLIRLRRSRQNAPGPLEWREILQFFGSPQWLEQNPKLRKFTSEFAGVSSQHRRVYRPMLKIPKRLFVKLTGLRSSGGPSRKGNSANGLSLQKLAVIGKNWPDLQLGHKSSDPERYVFDLAKKAVSERWNAEKVAAEFSGGDSSKDPKPDIVCRRVAALATALAKVAPRDKRDLLKAVAAACGARSRKSVSNKLRLTKKEQSQLVDCLLEIAGTEINR